MPGRRSVLEHKPRGLEAIPLELVSSIYRTAVQPELWPQVVEELRELIGAERAVHAGFSASNLQALFQVGQGTDDGLTGWAWPGPSPSPSWINAALRLPTGVLFSYEEIAAASGLRREGELRRTPSSDGPRWHGLGCVLARQRELFVVLSLYRPLQGGPFGEAALAKLRALLPHFEAATQLALRLAQAELQRDAAMATVDRLQLAVMLVDTHGKVYYANRSAERILARGDGLLLRDGELQAGRASETRLLQQRILEMVHDSDNERSGSVLTLTRPSQLRPLALLLAPLRSKEIIAGMRRPAVVLFISDPEGEPAGYEETLQRIYGLTRAEARVALAVVQAVGLQEAADALGVSLNTVRTHIHHIFQKTGTHRQADLVEALLRGPLQVRVD